MKRSTMMLIARLLMVAIFAASLFGKLTGFSGQVAYIENSAAMFGSIATLALVVGIILEAIGVLSLISGKKLCLGTAALILFTALATLMFHIPEGAQDQVQIINFLKNLAIIGGLLAIGVSACDCGCRAKDAKGKS